MTDLFLQSLVAKPKDDNSRLVYADWLEENAGPNDALKAEYLRLTVKLATERPTRGKRKVMRKRLQQLAAQLDTAWLAVVSRIQIENCPNSKREDESETSPPGVPFRFLCKRNWEDLSVTPDQAIRFCDECEQEVHYCDTIMAARNQAMAGNCIAIDLGVIRRERDLEPRRMYLGNPSIETLRREEERMQPDAVSAERALRKRQIQTEIK